MIYMPMGDLQVAHINTPLDSLMDSTANSKVKIVEGKGIRDSHNFGGP
jgi:hypothetical protein